MDATPPLVDGDVEHRALDGDQPGVGDWARRLLHICQAPPPFNCEYVGNVNHTE